MALTYHVNLNKYFGNNFPALLSKWSHFPPMCSLLVKSRVTARFFKKMRELQVSPLVFSRQFFRLLDLLLSKVCINLEPRKNTPFAPLGGDHVRE